MSNIQNITQNEIADKSREDISHNLPKENPKSNSFSKKKKLIITFSIIIALLVVFIIIFVVLWAFLFGGEKIEKSSVKEKNFSKKEMKIARYNTLIKLNNVIFPSSQSNELYNKEDLYNFYNFTYYFFKNIDYRDFSPIGLYSVLINIYIYLYGNK